MRLAGRLCLVLLGAALCLGAIDLDGMYTMSQNYLRVVRPGYTVHPYSVGPPTARAIAVTPSGVVFVSRNVGAGESTHVTAIRDLDGDGYGETMTPAMQDVVDRIFGIDYFEGDLYVATLQEVYRFKNIEQHLDGDLLGWNDRILDKGCIPDTPWHEYRYLRVSPHERKIYVTYGSPYNVPPMKGIGALGKLFRMDLDGKRCEGVGHGVRNAGGMDFHPVTGVCFWTENGRDEIGDNIPPDELNRFLHPDQNFGFPDCFGYNVPDVTQNPRCVDGVCPPDKEACPYVPAAMDLYPHGGSLGLKFYTGSMFPDMTNVAFQVSHGSWNRNPLIGYDVTIIHFDDNPTTNPVSREPFLYGFLPNNETIHCTTNKDCPLGVGCTGGVCYPWGRPVDIGQLPDGSIVVSDDTNGMLWRVSYGQPLPKVFKDTGMSPIVYLYIMIPTTIVISILIAAAVVWHRKTANERAGYAQQVDASSGNRGQALAGDEVVNDPVVGAFVGEESLASLEMGALAVNGEASDNEDKHSRL